MHCTQQCVKVWKYLVERYFNYYPETKRVTYEGRTDTRIPIYPRLSSNWGMKTAVLSFINVSNQTCCLYIYIYLLLIFDNFHKHKGSPPPGIGNFNVHLYFISSSYLIGGNIWVNKTSLTPSHFIEVFAPGQEIKRTLFLWFC